MPPPKFTGSGTVTANPEKTEEKQQKAVDIIKGMADQNAKELYDEKRKNQEVQNVQQEEHEHGENGGQQEENGQVGEQQEQQQ